MTKEATPKKRSKTKNSEEVKIEEGEHAIEGHKRIKEG
jgi:hypothetical protein